MLKFLEMPKGRGVRPAAFALLAFALVVGLTHVSGVNVSANHPVMVEGNCDSPVPGTTLVAPGTCGDFDGDGRIGTAEDTDGADRIFGTLRAALGPGTGAAAGTGANHNGLIMIVTSGRFHEFLYVGQTTSQGDGGVVNPGNVTIEAAPGVFANLDAVLQGDPAGGNAERQQAAGITVAYSSTFRTVTLRNLGIRNFSNGIVVAGSSRVNIDNCRFENNISHNILLLDNSRTAITNTQSAGAGLRIGGPTTAPNPGYGLLLRNAAQANIMNSSFTNNQGAGLVNLTNDGANLKLFKVAAFFNGTDIAGPFTSAPDPNVATTF